MACRKKEPQPQSRWRKALRALLILALLLAALFLVLEKNLEKYATTGSPEYEKMVSIIAERFGLTSLKFNTLETLIEAIGLPKCKVCTHCFDGSSHF